MTLPWMFKASVAAVCGEAVACEAVGIPVASMYLMPSGETTLILRGGKCYTGNNSRDAVVQRVAYLAADAAEATGGGTVRGWTKARIANATTKETLAQSEAIYRQHGGAIARVITALIAKRQLSGHEVRALIAGKGLPPSGARPFFASHTRPLTWNLASDAVIQLPPSPPVAEDGDQPKSTKHEVAAERWKGSRR